MPVQEGRYSKEEFARRGDELYTSEVLPQIGPDDVGEIVVIDIETGTWEMDTDEVAAAARLKKAHAPDAQIWMVRVGFPYVRRFGAGRISLLR